MIHEWIESKWSFWSGHLQPQHQSWRKHINRKTVHFFKLFAISRCAELLIDRKIRNCICICSYRIAINGLAKIFIESSVVDCMQVLDKGETIQVTLVWISDYQGILNKRTDGLTKSWGRKWIRLNNRSSLLRKRKIKRKIKEMLEREHSWKQTKGCWRDKKFMEKSNPTRSKRASSNRRKTERA